jgi:hypothetical protein
VFTDSPFETLQTERHHREQAIARQVFPDLTSGSLAHLPSGSFPRMPPGWPAPPSAQRAARRRRPGQPACAKAHGAILRRDLISVAAQVASRGHVTVHLSKG